jgi:spermidine synthase
VGQKDPDQKIDMDAITAKLASPAFAPALDSLRQAEIPSPLALFSSYAGNDKDLAPWLKDAAINHDYDMRLQYLAGLALNQNQADVMYRKMLSLAKPPQGIFIGKQEDLDTLFQGLRSRSFGPGMQ